MLRLLDVWLEDRPNVNRWWKTVTSRSSYIKLEEYPGQSKDDSAPHAESPSIIQGKRITRKLPKNYAIGRL